MKPVKIAINGFGRIGRAAFKAATGNLSPSLYPSKLFEPKDIKVVAINDLTDTKTLSYLLKYDSVYGRLNKEINYSENDIRVDSNSYPVFAKKDPIELPWKDLDVDVVLECTGYFTEYERAKVHIKAGAKRVIVSAPGKGEGGETQVIGTQKTENGGFGQIISNASCTTNCISPIMQILESSFGIEKSFMTTIHSYTSTQNIVDGPSKDLRRGRAGAINIIPTTTGAAKATTEVISTLKNKFDGIAVRVPVVCGSLSDITAVLKKKVSESDINSAFIEAERQVRYIGIIKTEKEPIVSSDVLGMPHSSIIDLSFTRVLGGNLIKVLAWYDNEWAYSCRLVELALKIHD